MNSSSGDSYRPELHKSVLSIRNILEVMQSWEGGLTKDLDKALWDGFVAGITDVNDQQIIIQQAQRYGFFTDIRRDWKAISYDPTRQALVRFEDLRSETYEYTRASRETLSWRRTVELMYGEAPERTEFPSLEELADEEDIELSPEEIADLENQIRIGTKLEEDLIKNVWQSVSSVCQYVW